MSFFNPRSFRVDIISVFCTLLCISLLIVLSYSHLNTSRIVLLLSDQIMDRTTELVIHRTTEFLNAPAALTEMTARLAAAEIISFKNLPKLKRFLLAGLRSEPRAVMLFLGDQAGNFLLARREADGKMATKYMRRQAQKTLTTWEVWDADGRLLGAHTLTLDTYDHRTRFWYRQAVLAKNQCWSDLYIFHTGHEPGITVSSPILDARGQVLGVVGCDLALLQLSHFLRDLIIGKSGLAFILNEKFEVVAYPDPDQIIVRQQQSPDIFPIRVDSLANPVVAAAFQHYQQSRQDEFPFTHAGRRYLASFTNFPGSFGNHWKVGVIVPEKDFTAVVDHLSRRVLVICSIFLFLSLLIAIFLARLISKPVLQLAAETDRIRNLQIEAPLQLKSHVTEIQILTAAIERMKGALRSFLRFAPRQLVQEVVLGEKELLLGGDRREVTLLFSDLRSFTQFAEQHRPEDVVHMLNLHFEAMIRVIAQHQGYVVDFLGDSLFVAFGALQPDPQHAYHGVACAVAMQVAQSQLNSQCAAASLPALEMGIGVNSGTCVVGNMGSMERIKYDVVGHAVNVAARIETLTVGGQVLISLETKEAVADQVELLGPLTALGKGLENPIQVWEVRRLRNNPELSLPPTVPNLRPLKPPVEVHLRLITGKQISADLQPATLLRLSLAGAALKTDFPLADFAPLQVELTGLIGEVLYLDGKIVAADQEKREYIVRFSPLSAAGLAALDRLLAADQGDNLNACKP
ncbi:MAG: adenylate/guanylate cyclase domain-containing protein [Desulfobacca sp.]|uniref:adenylate/guanylate cyclase domain-containing protein n=1 Tax=Desulfobacca sp. TaxID=2067990 RepID=UPI004049079D